jgi:steroid 5-alpha reductase family enzyme
MDNPFLIWATGYGLIALLMSLVYLLARVIKNAGIVDVFWGFGFSILMTLYILLTPNELLMRHWMLVIMVYLASLRLGSYLLKRFLKEHPKEDARYTAFKQAWGDRAEWMTFWVFHFQGVLMVTITLPMVLVLVSPSPEVTWVEWLAIGLFTLAWWGETVADEQLAQFKADPANKGKTCQVGLWRYSRHPNYFFEWLIWVAFALYALPAPWGWLGLVAPVLMLYFLVCVTGVKATEERALQSRTDYAEYQRTTSPFIPWFKRLSTEK